MGCCCGCLRGGSDAALEAEMTSTSNKANGSNGKSLSISKSMSAPTIEFIGENKISGTGLALAGVTIEQDAAYWEWHMETSDESSNSKADVMFGVATKKDSKFYQTTEDGEEDSSQSNNSTALMRTMAISSDDTVGVAVQQSDLPMIQFLLNGEPQHELAINRFRGSVYPSICLLEKNDSSVSASLVLDESQFKELSPHARFGPLIVARGII